MRKGGRHGIGARIGAGAVVLAGVLVGAGPSTLAGAATAAAGATPAAAPQLTWSTPTRLGGGAGISSLSCPSASFCGGFGAGYAIGLDAATYQHATWSAPVAVSLPRRDESNPLPRLSCASSHFCMAIAGDRAARYNGKHWTYTSRRIDPHLDGGGSAMLAVSCASARFCAAGGVEGYTLTYNGKSWSKPKQPFGETNIIEDLSCVSSRFCLAADSYQPMVYDGKRWRLTHWPSLKATITRVSCVSAHFCVGLDADLGWLSIFNGKRWGPLVKNAGGRHHHELRDVSCATKKFCVAVGGGYETTYDGKHWSAIHLIDPHYAFGLGLDAVSCPTISYCLAVDVGNRWVTAM